MVIADTSVVFKWFTPSNERDVNAALKLLQAHLNKTQPITIPDLLLYEVSNAWATKTQLPIGQIKLFLEDLEEVGLKIESVNFNLITQAATMSKKYKITVYDAVYIVLAGKYKCDFVTADVKLVKKVNLPFVHDLTEYLED